MKTACVIAEYNPLHNGHIYHLDKTREITNCDALAVIMSGNFVERGEAAVLDKYVRARHAVTCGADVVVELPSLYAVSGAKYFAEGAIMAIDNIKSAKWLSFGSECGNIELLKEIVKATECDRYDKVVSAELHNGASYPKACEIALKSILNDNDIAGLTNFPNNILGIEYIRALKRRNIDIDTITIKRTNNYHDESLNDTASATAIRKALAQNIDVMDFVDEKIVEDLSNAPKIDTDRLFSIVAEKLINNNTDYYEDNEGIVNRIKKALLKSNNYEELLDASHTKRYTKSRIRRVLLHIALDHYMTLTGTPVKGVNVLAVKRNKIDILSTINMSNSNDVLSENDFLSNRIYEIISASKMSGRSMQIID